MDRSAAHMKAPPVNIPSRFQFSCSGSGLGSSDTTVRLAVLPAGCSMSPLPPGVLIGALLVTAQNKFIGARHSLANTDLSTPSPSSNSTALGNKDGCSSTLICPGSLRRQPRADTVVIALRYETSLSTPNRRARKSSACMLTPHCSFNLAREPQAAAFMARGKSCSNSSAGISNSDANR